MKCIVQNCPGEGENVRPFHPSIRCHIETMATYRSSFPQFPPILLATSL